MAGSRSLFKAVAISVFVLCLPVLTWSAWRIASNMLPLPTGHEVSYSDFISVLLTGVAVLVAVLGLMVGALAILGYTAFEKRTNEAARAAALEYLKSKEGVEKLSGMLPSLITPLIEQSADSDQIARSATNSTPEQPEEIAETKPFAEAYPGEGELSDDSINDSAGDGGADSAPPEQAPR